MSMLMLSMGSLLFVILLFIIYFSKKRFLSIRNKIYRYMLVIEMLLLVLEIIMTTFVYVFNNGLINLVTYRLTWFLGLIWVALLYYYSIVFIRNIKTDDLLDIIFYDRKTRIVSIIFVIFALIYFFLPFEAVSPNHMTYLPGLAAYFVFLSCAYCVIEIAVCLLKYGKKASLRTKISVIFMIAEIVTVFVLQFSYPLIAITTTGIVVQSYFLYFAVENPDLEIISELEAVKNDIEKSNKAKSDFLSNMSHEIRTPMNAILGYSQSLLNEQDFDEKSARTDIKHISLAGSNLLDIINNILDISKIESGKETIQKKNYSLANVVMELTSIVESRIGEKPVKLIIDIDKNMPSKLYGDSVKIFQILLNILTNSVKYTEVGKIKFSASFDVKDDDVIIHFKVADTGYGIKKEDYKKLFEKFNRLDTAIDNEIEGTGLGLVITKKYVDLLDGKIWFDSEFDVGTTFYVDIPQKIVDKTAIGDITEPIKSEKELTYLDCSKFNALIVDDNKLNQKVASRLLEPYKFNVEMLSSARECIYNIKEGKKYDIIFLDHMMPEMDGIKALHILRKLEDYELPPIIVLTANAITGMKEMYLKEGFDDYLSKPINVSELNKIILKYLKDKR